MTDVSVSYIVACRLRTDVQGSSFNHKEDV